MNNTPSSNVPAPDREVGIIGFHFDNSYARLPESFFSRIEPTRVTNPTTVVLNHGLANQLGLRFDESEQTRIASLLAGNEMARGAEPIAQAYAGHQFGGFTILGDGRAILLGEHLTKTGERFDIQLKGAGRTPYSRGGDGRAALGPMLREYIISEAMAGLGIPTTRSLSVVATGQPVYRESALPGAILTRVAASHIRVGTFEYMAARNDNEGLRVLADYTIARHFPEILGVDQPYVALLQSVLVRQASLVARWLHVGFVHGVMNTDNMSIAGETIDYGPCAFMDVYDPATVFSSIDHGGRYAYANQPNIAQWNLARFAETLLPLLDANQETAVAMAIEVLETFPTHFQQQWLAGMRRKLGLITEEEGDLTIIQSLLDWMRVSKADYTNTFHDLKSESALRQSIYQTEAFRTWYGEWQNRLARNGVPFQSAISLMQKNNPCVIARNFFVEEALEWATERRDLSRFHRLVASLSVPYDDLAEHHEYRNPPHESDKPYQTYCGT